MPGITLPRTRTWKLWWLDSVPTMLAAMGVSDLVPTVLAAPRIRPGAHHASSSGDVSPAAARERGERRKSAVGAAGETYLCSPVLHGER